MSNGEFLQVCLQQQDAYRLINSKFPPIAIFDDVADQSEFEALFALQQLTNPRLQNAAGNLNMLPLEQIPFNIPGCSYACAPFTHINPDGSRFSDGAFGVLYLADTMTTAIAEVRYHQQMVWQNIPKLHYDCIVMRGLKFNFDGELVDLYDIDDEQLYHLQDYQKARKIGADFRRKGHAGLQYRSVRQTAATCWALLTPKWVNSVHQISHYEFIYDGKSITNMRAIATI